MNEGWKSWLRIQSGRAVTLAVGWGVLVAGFVYRPDLLKLWLRSVTGLIERVSDTLPSPWGDRFGVFVRTVGAFWCGSLHSDFRLLAASSVQGLHQTLKFRSLARE